MNLARHSISATKAVHIIDARFDPECKVFTAATPAGFAVYNTLPLNLIRKRELVGGTLATVLPLHTTNLLFLLGGGRSPLYPPNKVILWDDALGKEVAELEFRERVRGIACRRGWLAVSLRRRVVVFEVGKTVKRYNEWDTCDNPRGLLAMATAPHSTLLAIAGRQTGHVQLIHLPPCPLPESRDPPGSSPPSKPPPPPAKHPVSIIVAHKTALATLSLPPSGRLLATTSTRGTLIRIWDTLSGKLVKELRRGTDKAEIYGVAFRPDEQDLCVWSDKGTVHVFSLGLAGASNRQSTFSPLSPFIPLPRYFESEWSYAQYRIPVQSAHISLSSTSKGSTGDEPEEERCVVGWVDVAAPDENSSRGPVPEYQLIALTFTGGWYRLALPPVRNTGTKEASSLLKAASKLSPTKKRSSSISSRSSDKGKEKESDPKEKQSRDCILVEYRKYGRWDGWG
ncbi:SVP1-like protein 2 [Coprinopsis cinerea okayama7|uniref:SVP1-like protein 2 n=1 Tax=Coprinopsis cinerea (strain Okayama-7 / 130 / ATCC MYA-4618 / FGSC 9003) TaxID=240176 RepID=A8NX59_COPC7|nr:SVP1-like protein 2 [Coprinopsis cinerea okayama7\|eukprot:XP_001837075.1 SVP1-like protein 2 [Coprinopsis cinerea okayama7\